MNSGVPAETVLIVDDSLEIRRFLRHSVLEPAGYRVLTAADGNTAIQKVERQNPDLILLDLKLPGRSGLQVLHTLRANGHSIPAIVITFYGSQESILQSLRLGAKDYLSKPFSAEQVLESVARALAESRWQWERKEMTAALVEANLELQDRLKTWGTLHGIGRAINSTLDEADVQRRLMQGINYLMQVEACSLFLMDEEMDELVLQLSMRGDVEKRGIRLRPGQGIAGWVAQHKQPALVPDAQRDRRFFASVDQSTGFITHSVLAVPLTVRGKVLGVIQVINPQGNKTQFDPADQVLLEALAASVAVAVENARLHAQMRQTVTLETLGQTMATLSHYVNNSLQVLSMAAGALQRPVTRSPEELRELTNTIQFETGRIATVIAALNQVTNPRNVVYQGKTRMIDIEAELRAALGRWGKPRALPPGRHSLRSKTSGV